MKKLKLFIENILVYGLGSVISKAIPLIMVPVVTRLMPDSTYYGLSDMSNTIISVASALAIMGMYDGMYRLFFEKEDAEFKKEICSTAMLFVLCTSLLLFFIMLAMKDQIVQWFFKDPQYANLVYICAIATFVGASNCIVSAPTRMQNNRKVFLAINTLSPILAYCVSIPLLLKGYYVIALPLSGLMSNFILEILFGILNRKWFSFRKFRWKHLKPMLAIAIPLLPNFLIYWVFNSSDKLMITNLLGLHEAGIYAVGSKLGLASQLIYTAFAGGWQYFAFSTMKEKDQVKSNSAVFEYLGVISFACSMLVFALCRPLYEILFESEYVSGFIVSGYLFLSPLLQMLFQVAANQFLVVKKTWPNMLILATGAIANVCINYFLIPVWGIEGAAVATLLGYAISDVICVIVLCKMKLMFMPVRFVMVSMLMAAYILIWRLFLLESWILSLVLALGVCAVYLLLYKIDLKKLFVSLRKKSVD